MATFDRARFLEVLEELGGVSPRAQTSQSYIFSCPRCSKLKLYVRKRDGRFVCWYCRERDNFQGRPEFALAALLGVGVEQARKALYEEDAPMAAYLDIGPPFVPEPEAEAEIPVLVWPYHCVPLDNPMAARGRAYVEGRGVPLEVAMQYGIRYSSQERRVYFPVRMGGFLVGWQGRSIVPGAKLKVLSTPGLPRDHTLLFEERLKLQGVEHVVLTEGPFDGLKAHEVGGNVAAMGKVVTDGQLDVVEQHGVKRAFLALDPDAAQENGALIGRLNMRGIETFWVDIPAPYEDLGAMPLQEATAAILGARRCYPWQLIDVMPRGRA